MKKQGRRTLRNRCLDTLKGFACILVIFIHYPFSSVFGLRIRAIARVAVPFFFLASGYSYGNHREKTIEFGKRQITRNSKLFLYGFIFSSLILIAQNGIDYVTFKEMFSVHFVLNLLVFNYTGDFYHLWYLLALIYCIFLWMIIDQIKLQIKKEYCYALIIIIFLLFFFLQFYIKDLKVFQFRNWILMGMPFFSIGVLNSKKINRRYSALISILGLILTLVEVSYLGNRELYLGTILFAYGIFSYAKANPEKKIPGFELIGKKYSPYIYILHWGVMRIEFFLINALELDKIGDGMYLIISPLVLVCQTLLFAIIAERIDNKIIEKGFQKLCSRKKNILNG